MVKKTDIPEIQSQEDDKSKPQVEHVFTTDSSTENEFVIDGESTGNNNLSSEDFITEEVAEQEVKKPKIDDSIIQQNCTEVESCSSQEKLKKEDTLIFPADRSKNVINAINATSNIDLTDTSKNKEWVGHITEGLDYNPMGEVFTASLERENSEYTNTPLDNTGKDISGQHLKMKEISNQSLSGEKAVVRFMSHLGLGSVFTAPMWHTGIWVSFKPPVESEIIELNRLMMTDKIEFGRNTYGLALSSTIVYSNERVFQFALDHVYDITVREQDINISNLRNKLKVQDLPSFIWGFLCSMYPKGFNYRTACINDPEVCNHIFEDTINLKKLQWTDVSSLTEWQKTFMSSRAPRTKTAADLERYEQELIKTHSKEIVINKGQANEFIITLKSPTVGEWFDSGHKWITDIQNRVFSTLETDASQQERNSLITQHAQSSSIRQYAHFVQSISFNSNIIEDRETIELNLSSLSANDEVRTQFTESVVKYINDSTMSVIGIPVHDCPVCKKEQIPSITYPRLTNVVPLDMVQVFFGLAIQRLGRISSR